MKYGDFVPRDAQKRRGESARQPPPSSNTLLQGRPACSRVPKLATWASQPPFFSLHSPNQGRGGGLKMQIGAGASAGRPVGAGRLAGGDPATSGALRSTCAGRREGRQGKTLPAEPLPPLPPLPPPGWRRDNARPLFRRGLGRGGRIRARAFRPQPLPPRPQRRAGRTQVVFRSGGAGPGTFI